jgi:diguanylate cyclase (GGDEF)-like protein
LVGTSSGIRIRMKVKGKSEHIRVTLSFGVAGYNGRDEINPAELLKRADQAMYRAKKRGKNRIEVFGMEHKKLSTGKKKQKKQTQHDV